MLRTRGKCDDDDSDDDADDDDSDDDGVMMMMMMRMRMMMMMMMTPMKLVNSATKFRHGMDKFYQPNSGLRGSKSRDEAIYTYVYNIINSYTCIYHEFHVAF